MSQVPMMKRDEGVSLSKLAHQASQELRRPVRTADVKRALEPAGVAACRRKVTVQIVLAGDVDKVIGALAALVAIDDGDGAR
jgi:hypothetical protein